MKIKTIEIQNFRGFEKEMFQLNEHFNVFIGENGAGKTSVLDALAVGVSAFFEVELLENLPTDPSTPKNVRVIWKNGQPKPQIPTKVKIQAQLFDSLDAKAWEVQLTKITFHFGASVYKNISSEEIESIISDKIKQSRLEAAPNVNFPILAYYGTNRLWAKSEIPYQKQLEGIEMAYSNCLSANVDKKEFLSWYKTLEDEVKKFNKELDKIALALTQKTILSFVPTWSKVEFSFKEDDLIFTNEQETNQLAFSQLSDGYRSMIAMVGDIIYRCIQLNPHLKENVLKETSGVVLIDELDLHLHPNWQKRIVSDLKNAFPNIQFVATTHSPFIVQSLEASELINLDAMNDNNPNELSLGEVATNIMKVDSEYSLENQQKENVSQEYLQLLEKLNGADTNTIVSKLDELEIKMSDPAMRAFLKMQRLKKQSQK